MAQQRRLPIYDINLDINQAAQSKGLVDIFDGVLDQYGMVRRRPGLLLWLDTGKYNHITPEGIKGLYYWKEVEKVVVATADGKLMLGSDNSNLTTIPGDYILTPGVCSFATQGKYFLFVASTGGGKGVIIIYNDGSPTAAFINDTDSIAPTDMKSVAVLNGYILAAETGTKRVWYTKTPDADESVKPEFDQYFSIIGTPGYIQGIRVVNLEIYIIKTDSVEIWYNDGVTPFRRYEGAVIQTGCKSAGSIAVINGLIWWLNYEHQILSLSGRQTKVMSNSIDKRIRKLRYINDCRIFQLDIYVVVTFIEENKTFVYDTQIDKWYQWGQYNLNIADYDRYIGQTSLYIPVNSRWIVGGRSHNYADKLYVYKVGWGKDEEDMIRFMVRTAFIDHDTYKRKRSNKLVIKTVADPFFKPIPILPEAGRCKPYIYEFQTDWYYVEDVTGLPTGFYFTKSSQRISGASANVGTVPIKIRVLDTEGDNLTIDVNFTVSGA